MYKMMKYVSKKTLSIYILITSILRVYYLSVPLVSMKFIDSILERNLDQIKFFAYFSIGIFLVGQYLDYLLDVYEGKAYSESYTNIFKIISYNLVDYDMQVVDLDEARINQEIGLHFEIIKPFIFEYPTKLIFSMITIVLIFIILYIYSPVIALLVISAIPLSVFISLKYGERVSKYSSLHLKDMEETKGSVVDQYKLTKEERFLDYKQIPNIENSLEELSENLIKKTKVEAFVNNILVYGMLNGAILATQIVSGFLVYMNRITIGMLSAFQIYVSQFWTPVESLFEIRREYLSAKPALSSFKSFLELPKMSFDDDKVNSLKLVDYIGLDENKSELHHPITFEFKENSLNVISGDNGVGKTTLLEALLNLTDRYKGHVLINDKSLENLSSDMVYIPGSHHISKYGILKDKSKSSLGQKKLAQINLALKTDKSVYIFDEPTN